MTKPTSTPPNVSLLRRAVEAARYTISGIRPDTWMSPLQPLEPFKPEVPARQWDYPVGRNLFYTPRGDQPISFAQLRALSRSSELIRLAIETRLDQICSVDWDIKPANKRTIIDAEDPRVKALRAWLERPDGIRDWTGWLRLALEEMYVTDALTLLPRLNRGGKLYGVDILDGSTIFPLIDETGRTPLPPNPAYQQILKSVPKVDYTADELLYCVRKTQVNTPYGYSVVEQIAMSARTDIERIKYTLAYFTEGSVPDAYMTAPEDMSPDKIHTYEEYLNAQLSGNAIGRRQLPIMPHGMELHQLKEIELKNAFDEWLWRKIAFAFSIPPNPLVAQVNRATAESELDRSSEEGITPILIWFKRLINNIIVKYWGITDLEFSWIESRDIDEKSAAEIDVAMVNGNIMTINEIRDQRGLTPVAWGDEPPQQPMSGFDIFAPEDAQKIQKKKSLVRSAQYAMSHPTKRP